MNRYESLRIGILRKAAAFLDCTLYANTYSLGVEYGVPEPHVREQLLRLAEEKLIALTARDGAKERQYTEWPDKESFFFDVGYVQVRLLSEGGELLSSLPKAPLGFVASPR
jgi:hypothetical protein